MNTLATSLINDDFNFEVCSFTILYVDREEASRVRNLLLSYFPPSHVALIIAQNMADLQIQLGLNRRRGQEYYGHFSQHGREGHYHLSLVNIIDGRLMIALIKDQILDVPRDLIRSYLPSGALTAFGEPRLAEQRTLQLNSSVSLTGSAEELKVSLGENDLGEAVRQSELEQGDRLIPIQNLIELNLEIGDMAGAMETSEQNSSYF